MGKDRQPCQPQDQIGQDAEEPQPAAQEKTCQHGHKNLQGNGHLPDSQGYHDMDERSHGHQSRKQAAKGQRCMVFLHVLLSLCPFSKKQRKGR